MGHIELWGEGGWNLFFECVPQWFGPHFKEICSLCTGQGDISQLKAFKRGGRPFTGAFHKLNHLMILFIKLIFLRETF